MSSIVFITGNPKKAEYLYFSDGRTSAELTPIEYERFYTEEKPFAKIREFLMIQA